MWWRSLFLCLLVKVSVAVQTCDSMTKPELVYFDVPGRAEAIRILFHIAGVEYTDTRFPFQEWPTIKPTTPLGFVPVMKFDGKEYTQSVSLTRYAAKLAGWYPVSDLQALKCDMVAESINEVTSAAPRSSDPEEFKKLRQEFQKTTMTKYWTWIEKIIQDNGGIYVSGGNAPTYADLLIALAVPGIENGTWTHVDSNFFESYPGVLATYKAVQEHEQVKAYIESKGWKSLNDAGWM